jgi:hypothetical protein
LIWYLRLIFVIISFKTVTHLENENIQAFKRENFAPEFAINTCLAFPSDYIMAKHQITWGLINLPLVGAVTLTIPFKNAFKLTKTTNKRILQKLMYTHLILLYAISMFQQSDTKFSTLHYYGFINNDFVHTTYFFSYYFFHDTLWICITVLAFSF